MKYKKRVYIACELYEGEALKSYLEHMALEGYRLVKIGSYFLYFEVCEPHPIRYCVEIMEKASVYASNQTLALKRYREFCKDAGWDYIGTNGFLHVFYTEDMDALPVETDAQERYERTCQICRKNNRIITITFALFMLFNLYSCALEKSFLNFNGYVFFFLLIFLTYQLIGTRSWIRKARRSLEENGTLPALDWESTRRKNKWLLLSVLFLTVILFGMVLAKSTSQSLPFLVMYLLMYAIMLFIFSRLLHWLREKKAYSKKTNILIYWGVAAALTVFTTVVISILIFRIIFKL